MKRSSVAAILIGCFVCLFFTPGGTNAQTPSKYVVGGIYALSGPMHSKTMDQNMKFSNLMVKEANERGGIDGGKMEFVWEDHKGRGPEAVAAIKKLIDIDHTPVVVISFTTPIMACAPIADQKKVLLLNFGAYGPKLSGAGKYLFNLPANELILIRAMIDYAKKTKNLKSLGLIYINDDMGTSVRDFLIDYCPKVGIKFLGSEAFDASATEYSAQIEKARRWNADAIYLSIQTQPRIIRQATEKGWTPQWIGCPLYANEENLTQSGQGIKGAIAGIGDQDLGRNPVLAKVKESWEKEYGKGTWPTAGVSQMVNHYDYVHIIKTIAEYGKKKGWKDYWTGEKLRQALVDIKSFDSCTGKITFDTQTGLSYRNAEIVVATEDPNEKGKYFWKSLAFYTAEQITKLGK